MAGEGLLLVMFYRYLVFFNLFSIFTNNWLQIIAWLEDFKSYKYRWLFYLNQ